MTSKYFDIYVPYFLHDPFPNAFYNIMLIINGELED